MALDSKRVALQWLKASDGLFPTMLGDTQHRNLHLLTNGKVASSAYPGPLTNEQKRFLSDIAKALHNVLKDHVDEAKPYYSARTDYQTGKTYARDGFGRKSILLGIPHARITVYVNATKRGALLGKLPSMDFLLSADGETAIVKNDTPWGRGNKSMTSREIGTAWAKDIVKRIEDNLRERQRVEIRKQQEPIQKTLQPTWVVRHMTPQELQAALEKLGVSSKVVSSFQMGKAYLHVGTPVIVHLIWGHRDTDVYWFLSGEDSAYGRDMPGPRSDYRGEVPLNYPVEDLARDIKQALDRLSKARKVQKTKEEEAQRAKDVEEEETWSVARTGYDIGDDEEGDYQGYVAQVRTFPSKERAIAYAKSVGGAAVLRGTQMVNEPLGQVEEHDRYVEYRYYR